MSSKKVKENYFVLLAQFYLKENMQKMAKKYKVSDRQVRNWKRQLLPTVETITPEVYQACLQPDIGTYTYESKRLKDGGYELTWKTQTKTMDTDLPRTIRIAERLQKKTRSTTSISSSNLPSYLVPIDTKKGIHYVAAMIDEIPESMKTIDKTDSTVKINASFETPIKVVENKDTILLQLLTRILKTASETITDGRKYLVPSVVIERRIKLTDTEHKKFIGSSEPEQFETLEKFAADNDTEILSQRKQLQEKYIPEQSVLRLEEYMKGIEDSEDEDPDETTNISNQICIVMFTNRETWFYADPEKQKIISKAKERDPEATYETVKLQAKGFYYVPRGNIKKSWNCFDREQLLRGGRNTGKTLSNAFRGHIACCQYPGTRILVLRAKLATVHDSFGETFEKRCAGIESSTGYMENNFIRRTGKRDDNGFIYWNGSTISYAGTQDRGDVLSKEYDIVINPQSEQILLDDWVYVLTSIGRGIGNNTPYHFILGDCNPPEAGDFHWLFQRLQIKIFDTEHSDNPDLFDPESGEETEDGKGYMDTLKSLPTDLRTRFLEGKSANSEMKIFPRFEGRHLISLEVFKEKLKNLTIKRTLLGFDAGFRPNPGVLMFTIETDNGFFVRRGTCRIGVYDEYWVERAKAYTEYSQETYGQTPYALYCEHDPQIQQRFHDAGINIIPAEKREKLQSIRQLQGLIAHEDQFFIVEELMDDECPMMKEKNVPQNLIEELTHYRWTDYHLRSGGDPVPEDRNDHWIDTLLYIIRTAKIGNNPQINAIIETISAQEVLNRHMSLSKEARPTRWQTQMGIKSHTPKD